jgi:hypothetical protein
MTIDNPVVLPLILLALLAGIGLCLYVIFRFLRNFGSSKQSTPREASTQQPDQRQPGTPDAVDRLAEWAGDATVSHQETDAGAEPSHVTRELEGDAIEIFRVLRVGSLGELAVEVDGRRYRRITQIRDGTIGRRVLLAIQELDDFVGPHGQKPLPEMHRLSPTSAAPLESTPMSDPDLAFLGTLDEPTPDEASTEQRVDLVGYWRKGLGSALRRGSVEEPASPKSFIDEIEELLQIRLVSQPDLLGRGIHFRSTAAGELRIEVDGRLYDRIDAIPEPAIVVLLKETIQAWEKS